MHICLLYDRLYPSTIGGAERWYRGVAEALSARGHEVTYLTLRHWERGAEPEIPGVRVLAGGPRLEPYTPHRRALLPPLLFGATTLWHLLRHGRDYDVVHTASFPYFSVLAALCTRPLGRYRLCVDWHEVWTQEGWRSYAGRAAGAVGRLVQRICVRSRHSAFTFSRLHAERLRSQGHGGEVTVLTGEYAGPRVPPSRERPEPLVVFAGRHVPEKRVPALIHAFARVHAVEPGLRCEVYGDGPQRDEVDELVQRLGLRDCVSLPGLVETEVLEAALRRACCLVLPSSREGYGLVLVEAAARGTPSVVVEGPDNAAVELVEDGVNGVVAPSAGPEDLAAAILRIVREADGFRASTADWYERNERGLSLEGSLERVLESYGAGTKVPTRNAP